MKIFLLIVMLIIVFALFIGFFIFIIKISGYAVAAGLGYKDRTENEA